MVRFAILYAFDCLIREHSNLYQVTTLLKNRHPVYRGDQLIEVNGPQQKLNRGLLKRGWTAVFLI